MAKVQEFTSNAEAFRLIGERLKTHATRPNIYGYKPHEKQVLFHKSPKKVRLYIGGNRSGKTVGGIVEDLWYATGRHPYKDIKKRWDGPTRGRIVSVDFINGHEKIIMPELARWLAPSDLRGGSWSSAFDRQERVLNFDNGSTIELMSYDQDLDKFAGTSRHWTHFDEEPPNDIYTECMARLVDTGGDAWITMTPIEGMTWIFDKIYEPGIAGDSNLYEVIEVSMTENPYLNEGEIQIFLDSLDEDERKAREHGKFVQLGGLIYKHFSDDNIVEPMVPPKDWLWIASLDHGFNNPTAWLWHAVSEDGQIVTFKEHYKSDMTIDQHAVRVHEINKEHGRPPDFYIGDPSIRNVQPISGTSIQEEYIKYGIPIVLANNDVSAGIIRVARYIRTRNAANQPLLVITDNCTQLIRELRRYRWATFTNKTIMNRNNAQEKPHKKDDHACFVAGTMIATSVGEIPIECVNVGDSVWTREGLKEVEVSGSVGFKSVKTLITSEGKVTATGNHPFWKESWEPLDNLRYSDMITIWNQSGLMESSASGVKNGLQLIDILKPSLAQGRVLSVLDEPEKQEVFNLKVKDCPEYFANGFLVSNCDSLRYFIMSRPDLSADGPTDHKDYTNLIGAIPAALEVVVADLGTGSTSWKTVEGDMTGWETDDMGVEW